MNKLRTTSREITLQILSISLKDYRENEWVRGVSKLINVARRIAELSQNFAGDVDSWQYERWITTIPKPLSRENVVVNRWHKRVGLVNLDLLGTKSTKMARHEGDLYSGMNRKQLIRCHKMSCMAMKLLYCSQFFHDQTVNIIFQSQTSG